MKIMLRSIFVTVLMSITGIYGQDLQESLHKLNTGLNELSLLLGKSLVIEHKIEEPIIDPQLQKASDKLFLQKVIELGSVEFASYKEALAYIEKALFPLISEASFKKTDNLKILLTKKRIFVALEKQLKKPAEGSMDEFLKNCYEGIEHITPQTALDNFIIGPIITELSNCLFEKDLVLQAHYTDAVVRLCVSIIACQRETIDNSDTEAKNLSDRALSETLKRFIQALRSDSTLRLPGLARVLNRIRINPDFLLFNDMLWSTKASSRTFKHAPIISLCLELADKKFLKVEDSKNAIKQLQEKLEVHFYEKTLAAVEDIIVATLRVESFNEYVASRVSKLTSYSALLFFIEDLQKKYPEEIKKLDASSKNDSGTNIQEVEQELKKNKPDVNKIVTYLIYISSNKLTQEVVQLISGIAYDRKLINRIESALRLSQLPEHGSFEKILFQNLHELLEEHEDTSNLEAQEITWLGAIHEIVDELTALYRTPKEFFFKIRKAVFNKEFMSYVTLHNMCVSVMPYGILMRIFDYFVRQDERGGIDIKNNWNQLLFSLECLTYPEKYIIGNELYTTDIGKQKIFYSKIETGIRNAKNNIFSRIRASNGVPLTEEKKQLMTNCWIAPVMVDVSVDVQFKGVIEAIPNLFTDQITFNLGYEHEVEVIGIYSAERQTIPEKLRIPELIKFLREKNVDSAIEFLEKFVEMGGIVSAYNEPFRAYIRRIKKALEGTISKI